MIFIDARNQSPRRGSSPGRRADAIEIEAGAKIRLADEYEAAQKAGEVASQRDGDRHSTAESLKPTASDIGINPKDIHEGRMLRDAEKGDPGIRRGSNLTGSGPKINP
jgi:hypothetical protein